jgi:hypothetical protein
MSSSMPHGVVLVCPAEEEIFEQRLRELAEALLMLNLRRQDDRFAGAVTGEFDSFGLCSWPPLTSLSVGTTKGLPCPACSGLGRLGGVGPLGSCVVCNGRGSRDAWQFDDGIVAVPFLRPDYWPHWAITPAGRFVNGDAMDDWHKCFTALFDYYCHAWACEARVGSR